MSRWFRFYDDAVNDPKLLRLSDSMFRAWVTLLCLASKHDGSLPKTADIALVLRMKAAKVAEWLTVLTAGGLLDCNADGTFTPHNWNARQFKSDVSNERVKRYRERKCNVTSGVTVTPPETDTEQIQKQKDSEPIGSGADAPIDHRRRLFDEGLSKLARMTGKGPDAVRSFVGKCLKAASDDAVTVLGLIEEAERNQAVDPSAWIAARLKPVGIPNGRRTVQDAARDLHEETLRRVRELDEPAPNGLRGPEGAHPVRLLSSR
jgi:hypothetical protein